MASGNGRLMKELAEVSKEDSSGVIAKPVREGDLRHLKGKINGPLETVYEGGVFDIDIIIPKQYPFEPPKMMFITKIWHPNISSQTGAICLVSNNRSNGDVPERLDSAISFVVLSTIAGTNERVLTCTITIMGILTHLVHSFR